MILFSECVLQGYDYDLDSQLVHRVAVTKDSAPCDRIVAMAQEHRMIVMVGFFEHAGDAYYNSVLIAFPDATRDVQRKNVLTPSETDADLTRGARDRRIIEINGIRCAIIICADGGIEGLYEMLKAKRVDYRLCPAGGGGKMADMLHESDLDTEDGRKRYVENRPRVFNTEHVLENDLVGISFTAANALGPVGKQTCHQGHCMIVDSRDVMRAQIPGTIVLEHQHDQMIHAVLNFD